MLLHRIFFKVLLILLVSQANVVVACAGGLADGERELVLQLQSRQFYDLAEQFCIRKSESCRTQDDRALWQMLLADCREQHAWYLREPGRSQLLTHATESITQFIHSEKPSAELDLLLRVRQIELLSTIVRIDATCREFGPKTAISPLATQALNEGLQLAEAMLDQIELIRRDIESGVAREARDRTRYVVAELLLIQSRQSPTNEGLQVRATTAAEQLMRSSGDVDVRFIARSLLAESLLDKKDFTRFDLSVTSLSSMTRDSAHQIAVAALRIRGLLRREQPSEALQLCLNLEKQSLQSEQLSVLRLTSVLHLFELLHKLDASELRQKTADEFRLLDRRLSRMTTGVWQECCERLAVRFGHVEEFGPEAATAIETVTDLINVGDLKSARASLLEMRLSFARSQPAIAATLSLQAGDLAIHLGDWQSAETDLTSAVALFKSLNNREQEAAADLLRIYAVGRRWDAESSKDTASVKQQETVYRDALERHIAEYSDLNTSAKTREWRAMLLRSTDPVAAAIELLELADRSLDDSAILLIQSGEILIEALFGLPPEGKHVDSEQLMAAITDWGKHADPILANAPVTEASAGFSTWQHHVLEIQRLVFSLDRRWSTQDDWHTLATSANLHLDAMEKLDALEPTGPKSTVVSTEQQAQVEAARFNGAVIVALAACRQLLGPVAIEESRSQLLKANLESRLRLIRLLLHQAGEIDNPIPGDPQIGFLALDLLRDEQPEPVPVQRRLALLPDLLMASNAADSFREFDAMIGILTNTTLSDVQLQTIATVLQKRSQMKASGITTTESVRHFWRSVLERSQSGNDRWFEASLQLATIAVQEGRYQEAEKVLNVISALHPEWGMPERRSRAEALKRQLELAR
jgi:hypothetical protein